MSARTLCQLFEESAEKFADRPMMWENNGAGYEAATYRDIRRRVHLAAAGLLRLGLQPGERVALLSEGRNDWIVSELAVLACGGMDVPLSVKLIEAVELKFRLDHSGCRFAIVSGQQAGKVREVEADLPELEKLILLDGEALSGDELTFGQLLQMGGEYLEKNKNGVRESWESVTGDTPANICYTSGTTADPKGIILTHRNYTANVEQALAIIPVPGHYISLHILPWDHSFAHTAGIYTLIKQGASMASVQRGGGALDALRNIPKNIREIKPHFLLSVPALAKNLRKNIEKGVQAKGKKVERLFKRALATAYKYYKEGYNKGKGFAGLTRPLVALYDRILFRKIRESLGGRMEFFIGGGALLDIELQRFFYALGIPMFQGYGLSEAAPIISANTIAAHKLGSSGRIVPGLQIRILDDDGVEVPEGEKGEIVVRGENVMAAYWRNDAATAEALQNGWLHTGDLGYMDKDGYLYVLGRFKSLLIGNDGEKYSPEGIEEAIVETSSYINQIMLYNDQSPYTTALLVPDKGLLNEMVKSEGLNYSSEKGQRFVLRLLQEEIDAFREGGVHEGQFPARWLPAAISVLGEGFTEQNRLMNSTMKIVRPRICELYTSRITYMYTAEGKDIENPHNMKIVSRFE